jgi:hypothetical protein
MMSGHQVGGRGSGRWTLRISFITLVVAVVVLVVLSLVPLKQAQRTGVDWSGFVFGQGTPSVHFFGPGDFCPSTNSNGHGRVSILWATESGQPVRSLALTVQVPPPVDNLVIYNSTNASSGGYSFDLSNNNGITPCGVDYTMVMYSSSPNPTVASIMMVYNYTAEVPIV